MSTPSVCCLCLTADRQRLTDRAVQCFLDQTHTGAHLLIYDTGEKPYERTVPVANGSITAVYNPSARGHKIGALRNEAIGMVKADIIVHWDSDDWSAPERVAYQVVTLQGKYVMATGFHNLLFLDTRRNLTSGECNSAAWEYDYKRFQGYNPRIPHVLGSSLAYWRATWQAQPFSGTKTYEDPDWCRKVAIYETNGVGVQGVDHPYLIAEVHGGNVSSSYAVFDRYQPHVNPEWRRASEWDAYCRERLYP